MPTPNNTPQAFLEIATMNLLRTASPAGLGYGEMFCKRMFDGQPPSVSGQWFASVWSPASVKPGPAVSTTLDQYRGVNVTITVRFVKPFDQWLTHRDFLEQKANDVVALIHADCWNRVITNAANALGNYRGSGSAPSTKSVGFVEGLQWEGSDAVQDVGPDWFHAKADDATAVGVSQTLRFGKSRRIQNKANMEQDVEAFGLILGHLIGDYVLQNDWMAKNKVNDYPRFQTWEDRLANNGSAMEAYRTGHIACSIHCLLYTLSVCAFSFWWMPWWGVLACFLVHWPIDRFRLAAWWMKNVSGQAFFASKDHPMFPWSIVVVDNIAHLLTLYLIALPHWI